MSKNKIGCSSQTKRNKLGTHFSDWKREEEKLKKKTQEESATWVDNLITWLKGSCVKKKKWWENKNWVDQIDESVCLYFKDGPWIKYVVVGQECDQDGLVHESSNTNQLR